MFGQNQISVQKSTLFQGQISNFEEQDGINQLCSASSSKASTNDTSTNGSHSDIEDQDMAKDINIPTLARAPRSQFVDSGNNDVRNNVPALTRQMTSFCNHKHHHHHHHHHHEFDDFSSFSASAEATRPQKKKFNNKEERFEFN